MEIKTHVAKKVYYYGCKNVKDELTASVTIDEDIAKVDKDYRLANINEVNMHIEDLELKDGYIKIIEISDGIFGWMEYGWVNDTDNDDYFCEYVKMRCNMEDEVREMKEFVGKLRSLKDNDCLKGDVINEN